VWFLEIDFTLPGVRHQNFSNLLFFLNKKNPAAEFLQPGWIDTWFPENGVSVFYLTTQCFHLHQFP